MSFQIIEILVQGLEIKIVYEMKFSNWRIFSHRYKMDVAIIQRKIRWDMTFLLACLITTR